MTKQASCKHCPRPVMDRPGAKLCLGCFSFSMARLLDEDGMLPHELDNLTVKEAARFFGGRWDTFAIKCYAAVLAR